MQINFKKQEWEQPLGSYEAQITMIEHEDNQFYKAEDKNSTPTVLTVHFLLFCPKNGATPFKQRFVAPVANGKNFFSQMLRMINVVEDEGTIDTDVFHGMDCEVSIVRNAKGYSTVESIKKIMPTKDTKEKQRQKAIAEVKKELGDEPSPVADLPF